MSAPSPHLDVRPSVRCVWETLHNVAAMNY